MPARWRRSGWTMPPTRPFCCLGSGVSKRRRGQNPTQPSQKRRSRRDGTHIGSAAGPGSDRGTGPRRSFPERLLIPLHGNPEEGPEAVGLGLPGFPGLDELPPRRLVSVCSAECDPQEHEPFDVFRPLPLASLEPSIRSAHAILTTDRNPGAVARVVDGTCTASPTRRFRPTSATAMPANQLRLWLTSMAYVLLSALRRFSLAGTHRAAKLVRKGGATSTQIVLDRAGGQ